MKVQGFVTITIHDAETWKILEKIEQKNTIPAIGRTYLGLIVKGSVDPPTDVAVGTSNIATLDTATALAAQVFSSNITQRINITNGVRIRYLLSSASANGNTINEAGIFGPPIPLAYMLSRVIYADIVKTNSIAVNFSWDITFS